jgi:hypothetical protein
MYTKKMLAVRRKAVCQPSIILAVHKGDKFVAVSGNHCTPASLHSSLFQIVQCDFALSEPCPSVGHEALEPIGPTRQYS